MKYFVRTLVNGVVVHEEIRHDEPPKRVKVPKQWPLLLLPMKSFCRETDEGLGDIIERMIGPIGGELYKKWYKKLFGKTCGCSRRKGDWNYQYPCREKSA